MRNPALETLKSITFFRNACTQILMMQGVRDDQLLGENLIQKFSDPKYIIVSRVYTVIYKIENS